MSDGQKFYKLVLKLVDKTEELPPLNGTHRRIIDLVEKDASLKEIAEKIEPDLELSATLLRRANSAFYMPRKSIGDIREALSLVGTKQLTGLFLIERVRKAVGSDTEFKKEIWEHSYQAAFYSNLLFNEHFKNTSQTDAYTGGLLHDIGKLIALNFDSESKKDLDDADNLKEKIQPGHLKNDFIKQPLCHPELGAMLAKKWNFPDDLAYAILSHHDLKLGADKPKPISFCAYFSNVLCRFQKIIAPIAPIAPDEEKAQRYYDLIDERALKAFKVSNIAGMKKMSEEIKILFDKNKRALGE